jgi:hypothetical protein|tara:strand:+ start:26 stop:802 length:777 start_codon:yes stop_codon:yes gene_type:complete
VCVDANAGARAQARAEAKKQDAIHRQRALSFWNRETQFARNLDRSVIGLSRDQSDIRQNILYQTGAGRLAQQKAYAAYLRSRKANEGGRAKSFGRSALTKYLQTKAGIEGVVTTVAGRQAAQKQSQAMRSFRSFQARAREKLGLPAQPPPPVMLPPTNRLGGALSLAQSGLSIAGSLKTLGVFSSDIKLKENVEQVGVSPQGYNIYEFNYKGGNVRFRGAMAQDVVQKNPMAVGIDQNYLTVDYSKIDVDMEVVNVGV